MKILVLGAIVLLIGCAVYRLYPRTLSDAELNPGRNVITITMLDVQEGNMIIVRGSAK